MSTVEMLGIFGASIVPSFFWFAYFMRTRGDGRLMHGALFFLAGMVAAPVALLFFSGLEFSPFYAQLGDAGSVAKTERFAYTLLAIGPVEEMSKFIMFWAMIRLLRLDVSRIRIALLWSTAVALGFATIENWYYMLEVQEVAWHLALTLPFNHLLFSSFWGVGFARFAQSGGRRRWLVTTLVLSFVYHGLYDYVLLSESISPLFVLPIVLLLYIWLAVNFRKEAVRESPPTPASTLTGPNASSRVDSRHG